MSNYYVHRNHDYDDELAHAFGFRKIGSQKPGHKYYAREGGPGHYLYFYSPAEYAAYKAGRTISKGATAVRNGVTSGVSKASYAVRRAAGKAGTAVANATGYSAKQRADRLQAFANRQTVRAKNGKPGSMERVNAYGLKYTAEGAARKARKAYEISPLGKLEKTVKGIPGKARDARLKVTDAAGKVRNVVGKAPGSIAKAARRGTNAVADATGYSERQRAQRLKANADRRSHNGNTGASSKGRTAWFDAYEASKKASKSYSKTPLGKIEGAAKRAGSAVSGAAGKAKSAASSAAGTVRKTARKAGTAVASAPGRVSGAARSAAGRVSSAARGAANRVNKAMDDIDRAAYRAGRYFESQNQAREAAARERYLKKQKKKSGAKA